MPSFNAHMKLRRMTYRSSLLILDQEIVGYIFRCLSARVNPYKVSYFVVQYFFIVVAPVFFAAAIYTILSLLINATGRQYAPLKPRLILWIFITCDIVATIVQILGAALIGVASSNRKDTTTPNNILLGGLAFQAFTFLVFIILFVAFAVKARRIMFRTVGRAFYAAFSLAVILFYLRVCFRLSETAQGLFGSLNTNEVYFGTLEFMPVVLATWLLAAWYPGRCVPRAGLTDIGDAGTREEKKKTRGFGF
jgi:hypothetical protein